MRASSEPAGGHPTVIGRSATEGEPGYPTSAEDLQADVPHDDLDCLVASDSLSTEPLRAGALVSVAFAGLVGILLGYDLGIIAGAMLPIQETFSLSDERLETFVGILNLVSLPGSLAGGLLADRLGRLSALRVATLMFLAGNVVQTAAWSYGSLVSGRAVAGFAVGLTLTVAPLYCAEISAARLRGLLTTLIEVAYNIGIVLGYLVSWALRGVSQSEMAWRCMLGVGIAPPIVILFGTAFCMYESPRWLAMQGRPKEAADVLRQVLGPLEAESARRQLAEADVADPVAPSTPSKAVAWGVGTAFVGCSQELGGFVSLVASPESRWSAFLGSSVAVLSQTQGVEAILYYSNSILRHAGVAKSQMLLATLLIGCAKLLTILVSGVLVDHYGRRPLLIASSCGMGTAMMALSLGWPGAYQVGAMIAFMVSFSIGYGPITYVYNGEIYPQACRSRGMGLAMGLGRVTAAMVAISFLSLERMLGQAGAFRLFASSSLLATAFAYTLLPETKGVSLEDSAGLFQQGG